MNVRRQARALASSLLVIAGLSGAASAQYNVDEINTRGVPVIRGSFPTHVPGSSHNVYGPDTQTMMVEPTPIITVTPAAALYVQPDDTQTRLDQTWVEGQYGRNVGPAPAGFGQVASPQRQRELLAQINGPDRPKHIQGWQLPPLGTAQRIKSARHAQIQRRMNYNDRVLTRAEYDLDYIQANMWFNLCTQPVVSPWQLLLDSATIQAPVFPGMSGPWYGVGSGVGLYGYPYGGYSEGGFYGAGGYGRWHRGFRGGHLGHAGRGGMGGHSAAGHGGGGHR